ncbi:hypothetical protein [Aureimonas glaciei]|uniref:Tail protein n=1 Tax=Aureimonas glaciei TaxID=1776957 RepID=A0A917DC99_9HYPH|nr:hypothetical protein [Aureimonas glaciei]GGD26011.1 hypothetical protein GCM10011335_31290 [Aureimonas glaciei]
MARDGLVGIDAGELRRFQRGFERAGADFPDVVRRSLNDVARDASERMKTVFEREIEGGPSRFSQVKPGARSGSVISNFARKGGSLGDLESSIAVNRLQSTYLKYSLGEETVRELGDAGAASEFNFLFSGTRRQANSFGLSPDAHGNLPRNSLRKLVRAAQSQRARDKANVAKKAQKQGRDVQEGEFEALRAGRKAKGKTRRVDQRVGAAQGSNVFFGTLRRGRGAVGFWQRPDDRKDKPTLLVLGVKRSTYRSDKLLRGWNRAVLAASEELPRSLQKRLAAALAGRGTTP